MTQIHSDFTLILFFCDYLVIISQPCMNLKCPRPCGLSLFCYIYKIDFLSPLCIRYSILFYYPSISGCRLQPIFHLLQIFGFILWIVCWTDLFHAFHKMQQSTKTEPIFFVTPLVVGMTMVSMLHKHKCSSDPLT